MAGFHWVWKPERREFLALNETLLRIRRKRGAGTSELDRSVHCHGFSLRVFLPSGTTGPHAGFLPECGLLTAVSLGGVIVNHRRGFRYGHKTRWSLCLDHLALPGHGGRTE